MFLSVFFLAAIFICEDLYFLNPVFAFISYFVPMFTEFERTDLYQRNFRIFHKANPSKFSVYLKYLLYAYGFS